MYVCVCRIHPHFIYIYLDLQIKSHAGTCANKYMHTYTKSHTWHHICLNNHFLVRGSGLLRVWLEPLGDLSVWAIQVESPSKFALGFRGTCSGSLNSWLWYALFSPNGPSPLECMTHMHTLWCWWEPKWTNVDGKRGIFFKSILCKHIVDMTHWLFWAFPIGFNPCNKKEVVTILIIYFILWTTFIIGGDMQHGRESNTVEKHL